MISFLNYKKKKNKNKTRTIIRRILNNFIPAHTAISLLKKRNEIVSKIEKVDRFSGTFSRRTMDKWQWIN